jgi:alkaline phosphatase isozyme conversion protein
MKKRFLKRNILLLLLIAMVVMGGCAKGGEATTPPDNSQTTEKPGTIAAEYLTELSIVGPRTAGTETEVATGDWIQTTLEGMGYTVTREPFDYDVDGVISKSENIIAVKEGQTDKTVVLGAHYDSMDVGNGVDDNASGIAVVLEAAKVLKDVETPQTLEFIFFGAEEVGLYGSAYHVSQMTPDDMTNTVLMMNYDSLVAGDTAYVYGDGDANGKFRDRILDIAVEKALTLITQPGENPEFPAGTTGDWSDHAAFKAAGVPYIYMESTNWTLGAKDGYTQVDPKFGVNGEIWHTEFDTMDYLNTNFPGRIADRLTTFSTVTEALLVEDLSKL